MQLANKYENVNFSAKSMQDITKKFKKPTPSAMIRETARTKMQTTCLNDSFAQNANLQPVCNGPQKSYSMCFAPLWGERLRGESK